MVNEALRAECGVEWNILHTTLRLLIEQEHPLAAWRVGLLVRARTGFLVSEENGEIADDFE
jgi:hypothetical protein